MQRIIALLFVTGLLAVFASASRAEQRPDSPPPGGQGGEGGPPPGWHLLPRFIVEKLDLSDEQREQVKALEAETRAKLEKILTPEQKKILDEARPPRRGDGQGGQGGRGGPDGQGGQGGLGGQDAGPGQHNEGRPHGPGPRSGAEDQSQTSSPRAPW
jgi:Spy/CpxP family protein refolding chaperone